MALQLNLLHEEISEQRQRQRDPLKLGLIALGAFAALLFLYYGWNAYQTIQIKSQLSDAQADWEKVEPRVTAAQKRAEELRKIIDGTKVLDALIEGRFYWAPLLATLSQCVTENIQLTTLDGTVADNDESITLTLEGLSAAREPRAAAEAFREHLYEALAKIHPGAKVDFRNLEDLETPIPLAGVPTRSARFGLDISFRLKEPAPEKPTGAKSAAPKETQE